MSSTENNPRTTYKYKESELGEPNGKGPVFSNIPNDPCYSIARYMQEKLPRITYISIAENGYTSKKSQQRKSMKKHVDKLDKAAVRGLDDKGPFTKPKFPYPTEVHLSTDSELNKQDGDDDDDCC